MPAQNISRSASLRPNQVNRPTSNTLRVDSDDDVLKFGTGASGTTEKTVVDTSSDQVVSGKRQPATEYLVDGAITIATGTHVLTKATAGAYTLAAPTAAQAGTRLTIISGTAAAHVITATNLIDDGVTGGAKDTATFAAFVGAAIELLAYNLKWTVLNKNVVTIAGS